MPGHDIVVVEGYRKSGLPTIELMRSGNEADQRVAEALALGAERGWALGTDFTQIAKCLFTPEGERIAASDEIFLLPEFFPGLTAERYRRGYRPDDSIYRFYAREMGVVITSQRCAVRYECVKGSEAVRLAVPDPMPVLRFARISMAFGHLPVEYRIYRLDAENSQICFALP